MFAAFTDSAKTHIRSLSLFKTHTHTHTHSLSLTLTHTHTHTQTKVSFYRWHLARSVRRKFCGGIRWTRGNTSGCQLNSPPPLSPTPEEDMFYKMDGLTCWGVGGKGETVRCFSLCMSLHARSSTSASLWTCVWNFVYNIKSSKFRKAHWKANNFH